MSKHLSILFFLLVAAQSNGQTEPLPRGYTEDELARIARGDYIIRNPERGITTPPDAERLRNMAEWEEIQALTISWSSYPRILKRIVAAAKEQTQVIILSSDPQQTESFLLSNQGSPSLPNLDNITILDAEYNSVWMRDYGANPVYINEVEDLILVDWRYNRITRPEDDTSPQYIAEYLGLDLYSMTEPPTDLVNTGGNWMSDGFGTAFASKLVLEENEPGNIHGAAPKTEEEIDDMIIDFHGVHTYIKMTQLPFDNISHIDMHMKLLDEQTLLVGEYPEGIADGPQINANIEYVLSNFQTRWGTPFKVIRIPMPDSPTGLWPDSQPQSAYYRTYTNSVFVNNLVLVPTYREQYDTTALRIYREALPGYQIVPIDCDDQPEVIIAASGAIHCITHSVGVQNPLLISHLPLSDTEDTQNDYPVSAYIRHRDGIANATVFWKINPDDEYEAIAMLPVDDDNWLALLPAQEAGTTVFYYIHAQAESGKEQTRPMPAPEGYWKFKVGGLAANVNEVKTELSAGRIFPNPANAITCIPVSATSTTAITISLIDISGREAAVIYEGRISPGESKYFIDASQFAPGVYQVIYRTPQTVYSAPLMIR